MKWCNFSLIAVLAVGAWLLQACTKEKAPDTPEGALQKYVSTAFSARNVSDRQKLMELSTGDALAYLQAMDDATFQKHFIDSNFDFINLKMKDLRQENSGDVSLVYELTYKEGKTPDRAENTNKKIAYLTRDEKGAWKIKATKNVKSFVERKEDLVVTPETTNPEPATEAKPAPDKK